LVELFFVRAAPKADVGVNTGGFETFGVAGALQPDREREERFVAGEFGRRNILRGVDGT
jgi:hypothetical protein